MMLLRRTGFVCGILTLCALTMPARAGETNDCNANGWPDSEDISGAPYLVTGQSGAAIPIPGNDPNGVSSSIFISGGGVIDDVNVRLHIDHQAQGDLRAVLSHNGVDVVVVNRAGSNANACGPSIYGYFVDDYGTAENPLLLDDEADGPGIDCYNGSLGDGAFGLFNYAGPARPTHPLSDFDGMDPSGEWTLTVSDHLFYNNGSLVSWSLDITILGARDCNGNLIPDECEVEADPDMDGNENRIPDGCEGRSTPAYVVGATSRRVCDVPLGPQLRSEPRQGGVTHLRVAFDEPPTDPLSGAVTLEERTCTAPVYTAYSGSAQMNARVAGNELILEFTPGLENARTYRASFDPSVTGVEGEAVEFRVLYGDVSGDGFVNGTDRSGVIAGWVMGGFTCASDVNRDGVTTATDRSAVVGAWTGADRCAP